MRMQLLTSAAVVAALTMPVYAAAQTQSPASPSATSADSSTVGAVVVTARKRSEKVLNIPIQITEIPGSQLQKLGLHDFEEIAALIPSATVEESGFGIYRNIFIRGVGTPALLEESGVGAYVDGVFTGGIISNPTQYYDLDHVEVLRGPQGGLYGRDATGGAINIVSALPTKTFGASVEGTYASYSRTELTGTVNAPLADGLAVRATGWYTDQTQGQYYNSFLKQYVDANSSSGGRLVADYSPTSQLDFTLIGEVAQNEGPENYYYIPGFGETKKTIQRNTPSKLTIDNDRISPQLKYDNEWGTFSLVGGYTKYTLTSSSDQDFTTSPVDPQVINRHDHFDSYFTEALWTSPTEKQIHWTLGGNYLSQNGSSDLDVFLYPALGSPAIGEFKRLNGQNFYSYDVFGEVYYDPTPQWEIAANARYTDDHKTLAYTQLATGGLAGIGSYDADESKNFDNLSAGASVTFKPTSNLTTYAKIQTGFRGGGFNFIASSPQDLAYNPETSLSYEIGAKARFWDGRATVSTDVYDLEQTNVLVAESDPSTNQFDFFKNVGKGRTYGFEFDGKLQLTSELNVGASLSLMDPKIISGLENAGTGFSVNLAGHQLPYAPKETIGFTFDYRHPIFGGAATLVADGSLSGRQGTWQDIDNTVPAGNYDILNLRLGVEYKNVSVTIWGKNITNDMYNVSEAYIAYPIEGYEQNQGATYGVTARAHF
jgi:iron complex outermembrane receptor protein